MEQSGKPANATPLAEVVVSNTTGRTFTEKRGGDRSKTVAPSRLDEIRAGLALAGMEERGAWLIANSFDSLAWACGEIERLNAALDAAYQAAISARKEQA